MNHGAVGGRVISGVDQGNLAAKLALRILEGTPVQEIPVSRYLGNVYMFDYNQLARFGLKIQQLPANSIVMNSPDTTYRINREIVWGLMIFSILVSVAAFLLTINIRQRKKAEAALFTSEEKFSKAFQHCADVVGIATLHDGKYIEINQAFFDTFGYARDEVIGKVSTVYGLTDVPADTFPLWLNMGQRKFLFDKLHTDGFFKNLEAHWCTKAGETRVGLYSAEVVEIGGQFCIVYAWHDITQRKYAEDALKEAHAELETKVEQRTQELLALNEELIAINEELQSTNWELENEITERRRIEQELSRANQKLTQVIDELKTMQTYLIQSEKMAALGNLVAGIAHEINTPVGVGLTAASHLTGLTKNFITLCSTGAPRRQDLLDYLQDLEESSSIILKNLERAAKLIQSFKQVSADQSSEIRRIFNVKKYLAEILFSMHPQLKKTAHNIIVECDEDLSIDGFPGAFSQIITNLLMNSMTHAYNEDEAGTIRIAAQKDQTSIILTYSDDGKGISYDIMPKIFDPFYTSKRGSGGTGLGLYIIYNIITQQFKGTIHCESEPGKGTTFFIHLPLPKPEQIRQDTLDLWKADADEA